MSHSNGVIGRNRLMQKPSSQRQNGALLLIALVVLMVVSLLGISAVSSTNIDLRVAINYQHQYAAELAAEDQVNRLIGEFNPALVQTSVTCVDKRPILGETGSGEVYSIWQFEDRSPANYTGAVATAVKGIKYRSLGTLVAACPESDVGASADTDLALNTEFKVIYSYLKVD